MIVDELGDVDELAELRAQYWRAVNGMYASIAELDRRARRRRGAVLLGAGLLVLLANRKRRRAPSTSPAPS